MGREYPLGYGYFRSRCHSAFMARAGISDLKAIEDGIKQAEFVKKGTYPPPLLFFHALNLSN